MSILIKNGQVIDPATQKDEISDVLIENGVITRVEKGIRVKDAQVIDAKGCYVMHRYACTSPRPGADI